MTEPKEQSAEQNNDVVMVVYIAKHKETGKYFYQVQEPEKPVFQSKLNDTFSDVKNALRKFLR